SPSRAVADRPAKAAAYERDGAAGLVAPVEVARATPETGVALGDRLRDKLLARPGERADALQLGREFGFGAVHRLLEAGLLLRLEERMVVERVLGLVTVNRHCTLKLGIAPL